ncbi:Clan CA, family C19, ubiquitin hydrolase-like cysteine peptidase [Tritrichomonas foetus]|uniref:Ubiquitin carboxyl-terminal hydrolase n=1 Tax=Tritrichomonas foetus TaxID=1144522 RepID=A0A1J4KK76_9EUKA|nr:Clan CA, family C19, ubiquitin hydrolase-like cysteine peptidase [Tritrichomonas foetus]|eukprot:OHT11530.1 Clan CA, family C19, ubiquitin hydrolase-like cysteine peptidase [Tritrichomonas foetus]
MNAPPPSQQVSIIRNLIKTTTLDTKHPAYLISSKWLSNWKVAIGFNNFQPKDMMIKEINNKELLSNDGLRTDITENVDYEIITSVVWDKLYGWYKGGPAIKVNVEYDEVEKRNVAVIHKTNFRIYFKEEMRPFSFSIYQSIKSIKETACKSFGVDPNRTRLCDFPDRNRNIALDDSRSLKFYSIVDNDHYLLLETQRDDGMWVTVTHRSNNNNNNSLLSNSPSMQTIIAGASDPGVCGLTNICNSCYLNSALQCLCHTPIICDFFLKNENWRLQVNNDNKKGSNGHVVDLFCELMHDMWSGNNNKIRPSELKNAIGEKAHQFAGTSQQDSQEFLMHLMDILHEDLNRVKTYSTVDPVFGDGSNDQKTAEMSWERHKKINDSFFVDNFHGLLRSRLICPNCHKKTIVFDPFMSLTIPLPIPRTLSPKFIFVPYDLTQPRIEMQLSVVSPATVPEYVEEISQRIHRNVKDIVFAERPPNATILNWRSTISAQAPCYAFEIPPHSEASVFACARLVAPKEINNTPVVTELDGIFLVEIPREDATPEEVQAACEQRFAPFWKATPKDFIIENENLLEFKAALCHDIKSNFTEKEKMKARAVIHPLMKSRFDRERHLKVVSSTPIEVLLNPDLIQNTENFDWSLLRQKEVDVSEAEIEKRKKVTLEECFKIFQKDDVLDMNNKWHCPHCDTFVCANKKMDLWKAPEVLIIHLKRFLHTASSHLKLDINVKYPSLLDIAPYIIGPKDEEEIKYSLYGVIEHMGSLGGGHYTAHVYHHLKKKWYSFNDDVVKPARPAAAHNKDGYVLFYVKANDNQKKQMKEKKPEKIEVTEEMIKQMFIPKIMLPIVDLNNRTHRKSSSRPAVKLQPPAETVKMFDVEEIRKNIFRSQQLQQQQQQQQQHIYQQQQVQQQQNGNQDSVKNKQDNQVKPENH